MTTPELRIHIQKIKDRRYGAMADSIRETVMAAREQTLAHYEVALQTSRAADALEKLVAVIDTFGVGVAQVPMNGMNVPSLSTEGRNIVE